MSKLSKLKYSLIVVVFVTLMGFSSIAVKAGTAPIVPVGEIEDKYSPSTYGDWDYYVIPPEAAFTDVVYGGSSGTTADTRYTDVATNDFTESGVSLIRGNAPSTNILQGDTRSSQHDFYDSDFYPKAVRITADKDAEFIQTQTAALSLHDDYSTTFFAEQGEFYNGFFNSTEPFFIDIEISNQKCMGAIIFDSEFPVMGYIFGDPEPKMTYPVIPNEPGLQQFMLFTNVSTLVTLTPHEWKFPTWFPSIELNTIFTEEFDQGEPWFKDESNDQLIQPDNEMFSLRMFNISVEEGKYYKINTAFEMDEVRPGLLSEAPQTALLGKNFEVISGDLAGDGLLIKAVDTVEITLLMYSPGECHGSYSIFYQERPPLAVAETLPLSFNEDLALEYDILYTFTLSTPIVIRVNSTGAFDYDIFVEGEAPGDWVLTSDENFIGGSWRYLPTGTYAVEIVDYTVGDEIRFNSVPVRAPSALPLSINEDSIYAVELPIVKNRINFVNVSTEHHENLSIDYTYQTISKYNEFIPVVSGSFTLGNEQTNGVWNAWPLNQSTIREYFPTREKEVPILLVYPTGADNLTDPLTTFDGSITISAGEYPDQSTVYKSFSALYNAFTGSSYGGVFIPKSSISSTTSYSINSDETTDNDQIIGIPLNLSPNKIYNVTVFLTGNYSAVASLNATFQYPLRVMGGDLRSLTIFGSSTVGSDDIRYWRSALILTVSEISYLYLDILRQSSTHNATLQVRITDIGASNMAFDLQQEYNDTVSDYEVKSTSLLVKEIKPSEMKKATPGFEISLVFIALVVSSIFATKKRRKQ